MLDNPDECNGLFHCRTTSLKAIYSRKKITRIQAHCKMAAKGLAYVTMVKY